MSVDVVLDAALRRLDDSGDGAVTFRALARELGVTPMAVSHHVGSRKEMFAALVYRVYAGVGEEPPAGTPTERLRIMLEHYCRRVIEHPNLALWVFANPASISGQLVVLTDKIRAYLSASGRDGVERETLLGVIVDYTHGFAVSMAAYSTADATQPNAIAGQTIEDYLRGLDWILGNIKPVRRRG